ncbi:Phosphotransferase [Colletotrichum higginsianum IMI 349063]|uniref:Phosphotransferase n=1 Tax=Colletotrichum higginsianum (strain IMI 349063) TaxID=759273 RepID=A0A1B7YEZ0_COLHI|nr:Phosphotransferase [Colletotrichum higginsianum IMI 349063]OBR10586.1 Phosphotransferase [Colletotrichum higginsianum IMI 349063]
MATAVTRRATSRVTFESAEQVRKWGRSWRLRREVEAMAYVRRKTSIPVPAIIDVCLDDDPEKEDCWFVMERLPGCQLGTAWPEMDDKARSETIRQLRSYLDELHQLRHSDPGFIGSVSGGPSYDHRLTNMRTCGPFASVAEFHDFLVAPRPGLPTPRMVRQVSKPVS